MERWSGRPAKSRHSPFSPFFVLLPHRKSVPLSFLFPFLYVQGTVPFSTLTLDYIWWPFEPPVFGAQKVLFVWAGRQGPRPVLQCPLWGDSFLSIFSFLFLVCGFFFFWKHHGYCLQNSLHCKSVLWFSPRPFTSRSPVSPTSWVHGWILPDVSFQKHSCLSPSSLWCITSQVRRILTSLWARFPHDDF